MKKCYSLAVLIVFTFSLSISKLVSQVPTCGTDVPYFYVDLTGYPAATWFSAGHARNGNCCGTISPDRCTSFEVVLDTGAAMINFNIASGAIPTGSMFYQIGCGPQVPVGQPICIVGPGPHHVTFCKPGNNQNTYFIQSIPKPTFPKPQHVRIGCSQPINVLGLDTSSVTWNSIYPGTSGQYNSYLSCTNGCVSPVYTPPANAPAYVDYLVCGTPIATACGYVAMCDTVRIYNEGALSASVTPNPATFCASGSGVLLSASANGGYGNYSYIWRNQLGDTVGTASSYNASTAGIFSVEVRDELYNMASCPSTFVSVPVTVGQVPVVNAGADNMLCPDDPEVILNGSVQHATGVIWSGGSGTFNPDNTNLQASYTPTAAEINSGVVTLILTSTGAGGGCPESKDTVKIYYPAPLDVNLSSVNVSCNNSTSVLAPTVSGGVPPYYYQWNTGSSSSSVTVSQGNYCVQVTDNMGCQEIICSSVIAPAALSVAVSSTNITVNNGNDGTATANVTGGNAPYTYLWNPGNQSGATATGLSYGIYSVTVTDANGCSFTSSIVVNEPRCLLFEASATSSNVICFGEQNGSATVTATGGTTPYTYQWNDALNHTTPGADSLAAGVYEVVITDANNCQQVEIVVITQPAQLTNSMNQANVSSVGGTDGSASSNPFGGTPGYTFSWNTGATTQTISNLSAGTYTLNLSDNNNCKITDSVQISQPPCLMVLASSVTNVSCAGFANGGATIYPLHGTAPYSYLWNNGSIASSLSNIAAGTYVVTVTDANGCTAFRNVVVTQPSPLSLAISPTNIKCNDVNDGTLELTVSGGSFPYTYNWSNGINVEDQVNLTNGNYSVTVTDSQGCNATANATIVRPDVLAMTYTQTNVTCFNGADGSIDVTVSGGMLPYTYEWSNGASTQDISGLAAAQYFVEITDANGCSISNPLGILIDEPEALAILATNVDCPVPGSGVAMVNITPAGGWQAPYQISYDNGTTWQTAGDYNVLLPVNATYYLMVKDNNNCLSASAVDTVVINPEVSVSTIDYDKCFYGSASTGQVIITPAGGNGGPYFVSLDGGATYGTNGTYSFMQNIGSSYDVVVKDTNNCTSVTQTFTIPAAFNSSAVAADYNGFNISCNGGANGVIDVTSAGGTTPYAYVWNNNEQSEDVANLMAGTYSVVISDANLCSDTLVISLTEPTVLSASFTNSEFNGYNVNCFGSADGTIDQNVNGGVAPYNYQWSNGATSEDISSLEEGNYSVIVTDNNNCVYTDTITLTEPSALNGSLTVATDFNGYAVSCKGSNNGALDLSVNGGVPVYSYYWNTGAATEDVTGLIAGTYSVIVTDLNNCKDTLTITIIEPAELVAATDSISNYNGFNVSCAGSTNALAVVSVTGGVQAYSYLWSNGSSAQDLTDVGAGVYSLLVTDLNGCVDTITISISEPTELNAIGTINTNYNGYAISCNGNADGVIGSNAFGGVSPYTFNWSTGSNSQSIANLSAGTYSITVTDLNGCEDSLQFTLTQPEAIEMSAAIQHVLCNGFSNGGIDVTVNGGNAPYQYAWSDGSTSEDLQNISSGSFTVAVADQNNCTETAIYTVNETSPIVIELTYGDVTCNGSNNGWIKPVVSGGTPDYTYSWSNGNHKPDNMMLGPGMYLLTVTDSNKCSQVAGANIFEPAVLSTELSSPVLANGFNISFFAGNDGTITSATTGGTLPYSYSWSNGAANQNLLNVPAGNYTLTLTDSNGCVTTANILLTEPMNLEMPTGYSPNEDGKNDFFVVRGIEAYPDNTFTVFNRWGNEVYRKDNYTNKWNGTSTEGAELPDGTYFVVLDINNGKITLKGYVDLRR